MYKHITEQDLEDSKEIVEACKLLDATDRLIVKTYISALKDRKLYQEQLA